MRDDFRVSCCTSLSSSRGVELSSHALEALKYSLAAEISGFWFDE